MIKIFKKNEIAELANILKNDGVISVPTDTIYGICARIDSKVAYKKLIEIKKRPINKSFPIMCSSIKQIKEIAEVSGVGEKIIKYFMPGPITVILKKKDNIPSYITNGKDTIAIRMATSKALEDLIEKVGCPIFMTSANVSGKSTCKSIDEIEETFPSLDGILEGSVGFNKASTIIDCTFEEIKVLREGPISIEDIKIKLKT